MLSERIALVARQERFREAVLWQNRRAFHIGVSSALSVEAALPTISAKRRQHQQLIASYLQRYCTKNDTIGFFGPVEWAELVASEEGVSVRPGTSLLASRAVFFEGWCIDELAAPLSRQDSLRSWMSPRLLVIRVDRQLLHRPGRSRGSIARSKTSLRVKRRSRGTGRHSQHCRRAFGSLGAPAIAGGPVAHDVGIRNVELQDLYRARGPGVWMTELWMRSPPETFAHASPDSAKMLMHTIDKHSWSELGGDNPALTNLVLTPQPLDVLVSASVRLLILVGEHELPAFRRTAAVLATKRPDAKVIELAETGHLCMLQSPELSARSIREQLRSQLRLPPGAPQR